MSIKTKICRKTSLCLLWCKSVDSEWEKQGPNYKLKEEREISMFKASRILDHSYVSMAFIKGSHCNNNACGRSFL